MKLPELVSVSFKEDKHTIYTSLGNKVRISLWTYHGTGHVLTEQVTFAEENIWQTRQHFLRAHINAFFCYEIFFMRKQRRTVKE